MNRSHTTPRSFSAIQLQTALRDIVEPAGPDYLPDIVAQAARMRQRPAWTFLEGWVSIDISVRRQGVPRRAEVFILLSLLVALLIAGAVYVGSQRTHPVRLSRLPATPDAWARVVIDAGPDLQGVDSLAAGPDGLLAIVAVDEGQSRFFVSPDGQRWNQVPPDQHPPVAQDGAGWALVGSDRGFLLSNGSVWLSRDGFDWQLLATPAEDPDLGKGEMLDIVAAGPGYVAVGNGGPWYSVDGSDWSLGEAPPPPTQPFVSQGSAAPEVSMRTIAIGGDRLIAWGTASSHTEDSGMSVPVMWVSRDGRTWADVPPGGSEVMAAGSGGIAAADDDGGQIVVRMSADGETWEQVDDLGAARSTDADGTSLALGVSAIAASDAGFVAAGALGPECLLGPCKPGDVVLWTSEDGRSWSRLASDERFARGAASESVAWGSHFVVGGEHDGGPAIWISDPDQPER
jgi:hypothetical protein